MYSGTVFVMTALGLNGFITAQGSSAVAMKTVVIGAVLNVVLDPLFIFVLHMGVRGAAVATVLSAGGFGGVGAALPHRENHRAAAAAQYTPH